MENYHFSAYEATEQRRYFEFVHSEEGLVVEDGARSDSKTSATLIFTTMRNRVDQMVQYM
jgi:hypothetical protein